MQAKVCLIGKTGIVTLRGRLGSRIGKLASLATAVVACFVQSSALGQSQPFANFATTGGSYSQNFSAMSGNVNVNRTSEGSGAFVELTAANVSNLSSDLTGWYIQADSGFNTYWAVDNGADNAGAFYEMYDSSGNHALGSLGSATEHGFWGVAIMNNTGGTLNDFSINYNEVINRNPSTTPNPYSVSYLVTGDTTTTFESTGYTSTPLGFVTPSTGIGAPGTQASISPMYSFGTGGGSVYGSSFNWLPGQVLYLKWSETDDPGSDTLAGINNFNFTANYLSPSAALVWSTSSGAWDTSSQNWTSGGTPTTYSDGSVVQFNNIPADSVVTVTGSGVSPFSTTINNSSHTLTFQGGPIGGAGGFTMSVAGTVALTASNTYSGGTNLIAGTLIVNGGDNRLGAAAGAINFAGGTLQLAGTDLVSSRGLNVNTGGGTLDTNGFNASTSGVVTLNDAFTKAGAGNLTLTGAVIIQSPGALNVNAGTLTMAETSGIVRQVTSSNYNGVLAVANPITVNFNNGTYSGSGSIAVLSGSGGGALFSNNGGSNFDPSTINVPFNLNAGNLPFTPSDVTQRLIITPTANGFVATFAVSKGPDTDTMQLNGAISGNSDVNFTTSSARLSRRSHPARRLQHLYWQHKHRLWPFRHAQTWRQQRFAAHHQPGFQRHKFADARSQRK